MMDLWGGSVMVGSGLLVCEYGGCVVDIVEGRTMGHC